MTSLVLLPGMDGTGDLFAGLVAALQPTTATHVVSYPTDQTLDYAALEVLVRSRLPTDGPFVVLGESFSGPIAVSIAANPPSGLRGVILCCSFVRCPQPALRWLRPLVGRTAMLQPPPAILIRALLGDDSPPALVGRVMQAIAQVAPATLRARLLEVIDIDATAALSRVRVPVLYLRATRDRIVPRAASNLVTARHPDVKVVAIDAPHLLLQAEPALAARAIDEFLRDVTPGA